MDIASSRTPRIAVLIPCYNEALTVATVVREMRAALPEAGIHVCDNNSSNDTSGIARAAGALVSQECHQGKGSVVRRLFADVEADVYLLVDGDATYDPGAARRLVDLVLVEGYDFVNGAREEQSHKAYRRGHRFGNRLLTGLVKIFFGDRFNDMLSGYKCFSRRYVKSFPALSSGFEIETELTIHALELRMPSQEVSTRYAERPEGSQSKLRTFHDGFRILWMIAKLIKAERPMQLFMAIALMLALLSFGIAIPLFITYAKSGLVPRLPTAVLSTGLALLSALSLAVAVVLDNLVTARRELKRMNYLAVPRFGTGS